MKKILNIPNILSIIRILLVPFIVWTYFSENIKYNAIISIGLVVFSGLTDVVDGFIARRFNMITNVGKILDPIADKLTQFTVAICISISHPIMWWIVCIIFGKEVLTLIGAIIFVNSVKTTPQAKWWGKLATVIIFITMISFMIFDEYLANAAWINDAQIVLVSICIASLAFSFLNYILVYIEGRKSKKEALINESEKTNK